MYGNTKTRVILKGKITVSFFSYITGIQLSKELYDILYNKINKDIESEINLTLKQKKTSGLNSIAKQMDVNHNIDLLERLKTYLDKTDIKIDYYN